MNFRDIVFFHNNTLCETRWHRLSQLRTTFSGAQVLAPDPCLLSFRARITCEGDNVLLTRVEADLLLRYMNMTGIMSSDREWAGRALFGLNGMEGDELLRCACERHTYGGCLNSNAVYCDPKLTAVIHH
eukprot:1803372-Rhodomonas_salina.2